MTTLDAAQIAALRRLPAVDAVLQWDAVQALSAVFGHALVVDGVRHALAARRDEIRAGGGGGDVDASPEPSAAIVARLTAWLDEVGAPTLRPVINATGVIVHTNLGRAPLSAAALAAVQAVAAGYSNLEYDLDAGTRGSRALHAAQLLARVTGAPAATVVNNAAAAVLLMLSALCAGREVIVSRGQLVEIGGGFRMPDVMRQAGVRLVEVGTTNRTHLHDYRAALTPQTAAILVVHHSNYQIVGFTSEPSLAELAALAHAHELPLLYDQGSGLLLDPQPYGLAAEPRVQEALADGADVVAFSGDKLLGGPQAGVLCGDAALIATLKRHPLARAVRPDKLCLAALAATLTSYARGRAPDEIPIWQMLATPVAALAPRAAQWQAQLAAAGHVSELRDGRSTVGGGSLPGQTLPTRLLVLPADRSATALTARLRRATPPVVARIEDDRVVLDPRTVLPAQDAALLSALEAALSD